MTSLVLLPGMDGTAELFKPFVHALDGTLETKAIRYPAELADYAELEPWVRQQLPQDQPFVLLGESFSGPVALAIAASGHPGLVGLVLCCTFARCPVPYVSGLSAMASLFPFEAAPAPLVRALLLGRFATRELRASLSGALSQIPAKILRHRLRSAMTVDLSARLAEIGVPVLYLQALHDRIVPKSAGTLLGNKLPSMQVVPLDAPHCLLQTKPQEAAAAVQRFVRSVA